ncbi:MAG: SPFH domain-containing protein [Caldilineaceae bacterium]
MPGILIGVAFVAVLAVIAVYAATRIRTVEEGYVEVLQQFDKMSRYAEPGPYFLRPFEEPVRSVYVQQREVADLEITGIFTHGGIMVSVLLSYQMHLDPAQMTTGELYYDDFAREDQQRRIIKLILQEVVREFPPPPSTNSDRVDTGRLFSPFSFKAAEVRQRLEAQMRTALATHGMVISQDSLLISRLNLPPAMIDALVRAKAMDLTGTAEKELFERIRAAGAGMTDMGLVQMVRALRNQDPGMNTIVANGGFVPDARINAGQISMPLAGSTATPPPVPPPTPQPSVPAPSAQRNGTSTPDDRFLPLTDDHMSLLKSVQD